MSTRPSPPGQPTFSNITPTSVRVSWTASASNGGSAITTYKLKRDFPGVPGWWIDLGDANNLARNVTGLSPGTLYTFQVLAKNSSPDNGGWSNPSPSGVITLPGVVWVRYGGVWKLAVPYVRNAGVWRTAVPYVRSGGTWHATG